MRDGRELKDKLSSILKLNNDNEIYLSLKKIINPYIQFINKEDERCKITAEIKISGDIGHTWTVPYKQVPGRSMLILIRDAQENHTVIGLGGLAVQLLNLKLETSI